MKLVRPPRLGPLDYLVERRFPGHRLPEADPAIGRPFFPGASVEERRRKLDAIKAYREELQAKPPEEVQALYEREHALASQEALALTDREEQARPFNMPNAKADFAHWSKATYWTLDEALALVFGRAPEIVTWKLVQPYTSTSNFAKEFARTRDLAIRAKTWNHLYDPVVPGIFLAWARRTGVAVPEALIGEVEARGIVVADWKDLHDTVKKNFDVIVSDRDKIADICQRLIGERDSLKERVATLEEEAASWQFDEGDASYPEELDIAMQAWRAVSIRRDLALTPKQQIAEWLAKHYPKLLPEQRTRISMICNWEKQGGRRSSEPKG